MSPRWRDAREWLDAPEWHGVDGTGAAAIGPGETGTVAIGTIGMGAIGTTGTAIGIITITILSCSLVISASLAGGAGVGAGAPIGAAIPITDTMMAIRMAMATDMDIPATDTGIMGTGTAMDMATMADMATPDTPLPLGRK
jgi:hypothetical protein